MTKVSTRIVIGLIALWIVAGIASEAYRYLDRRAIAREAAQAERTAMAWTAPATTPEDARRWLETNGYRVIFWNSLDPRGFVGMQVSGPGGKLLIVEGQRQIRSGDWLIKPTWLNVTFRFTIDGAFLDVQADPAPLQFPANPPAA